MHQEGRRDMNPILSIAVVNFNYGRFLEAAIRSVLDQNNPDVELVIADGGSTDNSIEVIQKYANKLGWWISEPDKGQSDAFNKAFAHCRGKYLTWLNADDVMPKGCLERIVHELVAHSECEWFTGNMFRFTEDGRVFMCPWGPHSIPRAFQTRRMPIAVYGPATIFSKSLFERVGRMNVEKHYMMDTDLWMRFVTAGVRQRRINCFCWAFRMHEASKTAEFGEHEVAGERLKRFNAERAKSVAEIGYTPSAWIGWLIQFWRILDGSLLKGFYLRHKYLGRSVSQLGVEI